MDRRRVAELCNITENRQSFWKGKKVFVTGATGLLGSWIVHALLEMDAVVVALVRDWEASSFLRQWDSDKEITIVNGDLHDYELVERAAFDYEPDCIMHLGAQTQVRTATRLPRDTFESNIRGTWNILEAARRTKVQNIVVASSDKAYGSQKELPYEETKPLQGEFPYDVSKSCADLLARSYHLTYGLQVCITRCGNIFGPGDLNWDRIVPGTLRSLANGEQPIIRSDGKFVRDYIFVADVVDGYLTVAEHMSKVKGEAFNLSTGNKITVLQLFDMIIEAAGKDVEPKILNEASNEIREQYLSSEKAKERLGWEPRHSIEEALKITAQWYMDNL